MCQLKLSNSRNSLGKRCKRREQEIKIIQHQIALVLNCFVCTYIHADKMPAKVLESFCGRISRVGSGNKVQKQYFKYVLVQSFTQSFSFHNQNSPKFRAISVYFHFFLYMTENDLFLRQYYDTVLQLRNVEEQLKNARIELNSTSVKTAEAEKTLTASREPGQDTAEVLQPLSNDEVVIRTSNGPRYLTNKRACVPLSKLKPGTRVSVSAQSLTIMHALPPQVDPQVFKFSTSEPGQKGPTFADVGGLGNELALIREAIELPLTNPEIFHKVGIAPAKSILLTGPPGTGKSLICQALSNTLNCTFIKLVGSQVVQKYIGESSRLIREIFAYARLHAPAILMIDEIDSICGKRSSQGSSSDREIGRTMLALLTELDGFQAKDQNNDLVKCVFCTNRPQSLDPAFLRPGRISRKITIGLPDAIGRFEILKIHSRKMNFDKSCDFSRIVQQSEGFNGADLRNLLTEAGLCAIRANRGVIQMEDLLEAVRILQKNKTLEGRAWDLGGDSMNK
ncbi:26S_protease regulatory subunit S10B [Hexamita inflata]|uniref:26S protease regulatory subunit S10B n=1 Tax=Hexamita inflata TaxID=28002 RepID=A0AA86QP51_9EUKA|nr:26S protease regulatory subunit S10B [Hexamita inflata]